jgi:hypothetical protein
MYAPLLLLFCLATAPIFGSNEIKVTPQSTELSEVENNVISLTSPIKEGLLRPPIGPLEPDVTFVELINEMPLNFAESLTFHFTAKSLNLAEPFTEVIYTPFIILPDNTAWEGLPINKVESELELFKLNTPLLADPQSGEYVMGVKVKSNGPLSETAFKFVVYETEGEDVRLIIDQEFLVTISDTGVGKNSCVRVGKPTVRIKVTTFTIQ